MQTHGFEKDPPASVIPAKDWPRLLRKPRPRRESEDTLLDTMSKTYSVYIMTNRFRTTLYIGMTGNLSQRVTQHTEGEVEGFTKRYHLDRLVYYEEFSGPKEAIQREKQLKKWNRAWKERLIRETNPNWRDLREG